MASQLENAYIIGQDNFNEWSQGFDKEGYLKVLPHPEEKIPFKDPFKDWQEGRPGNYFSSWGPDKELDISLAIEDLEQIEIDGFGILKAGDGEIPWLGHQTPFEFLRGYNGTVPGPLLIAEPGDTLNIELENNSTNPAQNSNFHFHGGHVSPLGHGDNVLFGLESGKTWDVDIEIPDNQPLGSSWYHPHYHGLTNEQLASGLAGLLVVNPQHDLQDLDKWNPEEMPMHFMAINSFGIQQTNRKGNPDDPLNQDPNLEIPAGTPLEVLDKTENGEKVYELSDAVGIGFNALPESYDPENPTGVPEQFLFEYGGGVLAEPVENAIHTVNGQYNPTLELKTGEWNMFTLANMDINAHHVVQLVKKEGDKLIPQEVSFVGIDANTFGGLAGDKSKQITEFPILNPGGRKSILKWFEEPGTYYLLSNGTEEILGDDAPVLTEDAGFDDGRFTWGPQVLSTIEVTGDEVATGPLPEAYETLEEQSQETDELVEAVKNGDVDKERKYIWSANIGGALAEGNAPDDTEVLSFEGTYRINGEYFSTDGSSMTPVAMPMLDTTEMWTIVNESGLSDPSLPQDLPLVEFHPFHIHQNEFIVSEINGIPVEDMAQTYLAGVLGDTIALPPTHEPGTPTPENPYGTPQQDGVPSEVKIAMNFKDFPGTYVNHCHILFHEDAGMMAPVKVILNTRDTWLGVGNKEGDPDGTKVELNRANQLQERISLTPYGEEFTGGIDLAIADINYKRDFDHYNVTDNVTDVVTVQTSLENSQNEFSVKVFDGKTLIDKQEKERKEFDGQDEELLITEFAPFQEIDVSPEQVASVAAGDINGDGHSDIVVGIGGGVSPLIEIYSGKNSELLSRIAPFTSEEAFDGKINLAVGDATGDNFGDIIVGQGSGGQGLVEVYSGILIDGQGTLDGTETARQTALLSEPFQPYGDSYQGEIEVTSGHILQRPDEPNDRPVQTHYANITTMAVDGAPDGHEQLKVSTYLADHGHGEGSYGEEPHGGESHEESSEHSSEIRLETEFTPDSEIEEFSGTFADIPDLPRGEPVLFSRTKNSESQLIHLQEENAPTSISLSSPTQSSQEVFGTTGNDVLDANVLTDDFNDSGNIVFAGSGNDLVDTSASIGQNRIYGGGDNDELIAGNSDRLVGGAGNDILDASLGEDNNRIYGDEGDDIFFLGRGERLVGGAGNDTFSVGSNGGNTLTGGEGADRFWVVNAELPDSANTIADFELNVDAIGIADFGNSPNLSFGEDNESNATLTLDGQLVATFLGITQDELATATFSFG
ncbi:multicopper oxidase domain-containing protein [Pleurocapsales cyanobacterium LEGE 10410]|nr:multicopper oxidase domain-containing protein [Pleurocapsales cyanobacterium LEGE 10410]